MSDTKISDEIWRAWNLISKHPAVSDVGNPRYNQSIEKITIDVIFEVNLPSEWKCCGKSLSGVRQKETVRLDFSQYYPLDPPQISLRSDFSRNLPHVQPWLINEQRPVPCIYYGDLAELYQQGGLVTFLNQTADWLDKAALGTLIDPKQGWEPARRDTCNLKIIADAEILSKLVTRNGGFDFFRFDYIEYRIGISSDFIYLTGRVSSEKSKLNPNSVPSLFQEAPVTVNDISFRRCRSLALVVWPGKQPSGKLISNDIYLPEDVTNVNELKKRAESYKSHKEINEGIRHLKKCLSRCPKSGPFTLAVILLARRPYKVIGSQSNIELCPYITEIFSPNLFDNGDETGVQPAAHLHSLSRNLLAQMSGDTNKMERPCWTLIGAGSLGSKLALHLARAGNGPKIILDRSLMSPHNAARHALIPGTNAWEGYKALALSEALRGLDSDNTPVNEDAINVFRDASKKTLLQPKNTWAIVNSTASLRVREALATNEKIKTRVIETALFAGGKIGIITVEGPGRNPNTADLIVEFYALAKKDPNLSVIFPKGNDEKRPQPIGQGCGSVTMTMSDGRLSLFAAGMSEYLLAKQCEILSNSGGEILIGQLSNNGLGLTWCTHNVSPVTVVSIKGGGGWRAHVYPRVVKQIKDEEAKYPEVETGGVIMGRVSEVSKTFHVVDTLAAPDDSVRSKNKFILEGKGLRQQIKNYSNSAGANLYCIGTWHNHLYPSGPSELDKETARKVAGSEHTPLILLIKSPDKFHALLADNVKPSQNTLTSTIKT